MAEPTRQQAGTRRFIGDALDEAIGDLKDVAELLPHAGLPASPKLKADLAKARAALVELRRTAASLGLRGES